MSVREFITLAAVLLVFSCASHRKKANCSEIRYRLDHVQYTEDQREWIEEEWRQCELEYDSLSKVDQKEYHGIYNQFQDSSDTAPVDSSPDSSVKERSFESK